MAIESTHPSFDKFQPLWEQLDDTRAGEHAVKERGTTYLPATSGMIQDGMENPNLPGYIAYAAYVKRARFHEKVSEAITTLNGIIHRKPATFTLPKRLEPMIENATVRGETMQALLRRITDAILWHGRFGLLLDVPSGKSVSEAIPLVATYKATTIRNWDDSIQGPDGRRVLRFVVLDESGNSLAPDLSWNVSKRYRVLALMPSANSGGETLGLESIDTVGEYHTATFTKQGDSPVAIPDGEFIRPELGGKSLDSLPFVFVNPNDVCAEPDVPPLMALSNICLAMYRLEADYRQTLYMQGQDTLVAITSSGKQFDASAGARPRLGAGGLVEIMAAPDVDVKFVGVGSKGLEEMRKALEADNNEANGITAKMLDFADASRQSGEALRVRMAGATANLLTIAMTAAEALERVLRIAAEWVGAPRDSVSVEPNLDFAEDPAVARELLELMQAKAMGAPLSSRSVHGWMHEREFTTMDYEEEIALIEAEPSNTPDGEGAPGDDADDDEKDAA